VVFITVTLAYITVSVQSDHILPELQQHVSEMVCIPAAHCGWSFM